MTVPRDIELAFLANEPAVWIGPPGLGKTKTLEAMFKKYDVAYTTLIASIREPSDFSGMPLLNSKDGSYHLAPPSWVKYLNSKSQEGKRTAVFFDEISTAPPAVQAALLRVIQEGVVGEEPLAADCWRVGAMNPPDQAANGYEFSAPMANRFVHCQPTFNPNDFIMEFSTYWGEPPLIKGIDPVKWTDMRGRIASFLHVKRNEVHNLPKEESKRSGPWPSPRTWDKASRIMSVASSIDDAMSAVAGCVGQEIALELITYLKNLDLPDPEDLLKSPEKFNIDKYKKRGDQTFAILSSIHSAITFKNDAKRYNSAWKIVGMVADAGLQDVASCWARPLARLIQKNVTPPPEVMRFAKLLAEAGITYSNK